MAPTVLAVTGAATALTRPDPRREAPALLMATMRDWGTIWKGENWTKARQGTRSSPQMISSPFFPYGLF